MTWTDICHGFLSDPDISMQAPERAENERKRPHQEQSEPASKRIALPTANGNSARRAQSADACSPPARRLLRPREGPGKGVRSSQKQNDKAAEEEIRVSLSSDTSWSSGYTFFLTHSKPHHMPSSCNCMLLWSSSCVLTWLSAGARGYGSFTGIVTVLIP